MKINLFESVNRKRCVLFGHRWRYKDYSNFIKADGSKYDFMASRQCVRCHQVEYFYSSEWKTAIQKSPLDYENFHNALSKIILNGIEYN